MVQKRHHENRGQGMKKKQPAGVGMTPSKTELGNYIRTRRIELDLRQVPLADKCGFAQEFVSRLEVGTCKFLNDEQLVRLAKALQCDVEELRKRMPIKRVAQPTTEMGKFIRARREELGLTIEAFAKRLKIDPKRARLLEIRKSPSVRYDTLKPLATALELDPSVISRFVGITHKQTKSEMGQLIRSRRKELGLSLKGLAGKLDVSRQFVSQIEFGQCRLSTNDDIIVKLSDILKLDVAELEAVRPKRRLKHPNNSDGLGGFLAAKRLELHLTQREVGERTEVAASLVSGIETGSFRPSTNLLKKFSQIFSCEIPAEMIPAPCARENSHIERETGLGKFLTEKRQELKLNQRQFAQKAKISIVVISGIERGTYRLGSRMVERLSKALGCQIPAELIVQRGFAFSLGVVHLSEQNLADLDRIKELSDIRANTEAVRKSLKILRILLEKQKDGNTVCLRKEGNIVELEFLF